MTNAIKSFRLCAIIDPQRDLPYLNTIAITTPKINTEIALSIQRLWRETQPGR